MIKQKNLAITLRKQGKSYNEIAKRLKVAKSTLSYWYKDIRTSNEVKNKILSNSKKSWAQSITRYNKQRSISARQNWLNIQKISSKDIKKISKKDLKLIGAVLYWAEGYKKTNWNLVFCNSDPNIIKIIMRFFREICQVPEEKFKVKVQIHSNVTEDNAKKFWSKTAKLPLSNFNKSLKSLPKSSKSKRDVNSLPYGTFRISISDVKLVNKIKGWIKGIILKST